MTGRTVPQLRRHRRKLREATSSFKALISSPHDLSTALVLPAGARLALSHSVGLTEAQVTVTTVAGRQSWSHPVLGADAKWKGNWAEEGSRVTVANVPTGTLSLYMVDPLDGTTTVIGTLVVA